MPMNPRKLVPTQEPGVLDFAPGAAAAYSLRNLSLSYSGPVVTVRRSIDFSVADFTATEVSDGTLAAWCMGGDGFVKVWHDQSQNGNDGSQTTAGREPQIVDSGVLVTEGGKATLQFDGTDDYLNVGSIGVSASKSVFGITTASGIVTKPQIGFMDGTEDYVPVVAIAGENIDYRDVDSTTYSVNTNTGVASADLVSFSVVLSASELFAAINGSGGATPIPSFTFSHLRIGARGLGAWGNYFSGTISELIIYPTDMTALRTRIEGNLAWYY